jgi:hypothetical protein
MASSDKTVKKGAGLARGPALVVGSILLAFGLIAIINHNEFPGFSSNFPDGNASGGKFLGLFEVNGWTLWLVMVAGGLLLFGSAQHLLAKTMSLIVGLALGAAAVIALVSGDILGVGAANFWTWLGLAVAAVVLLLNIFAPRVKHEEERHTTTGERPVRREPVADRDRRDLDGDGRRDSTEEPASRRV